MKDMMFGKLSITLALASLHERYPLAVGRPFS